MSRHQLPEPPVGTFAYAVLDDGITETVLHRRSNTGIDWLDLRRQIWFTWSDICSWPNRPEILVPAGHHVTPTVSMEWCVWWGGDDPNECAGHQVFDEPAKATEMVQWIVGGSTAVRRVLTGQWIPLADWPVCGCPDCIRCGCNWPWTHHTSPAECTRLAVPE